MAHEITRRQIERLVREVLSAMQDGLHVPIGVSNRHVHLCREDMDKLFGEGSELTKMKDLLQPGQYACEETLTICGPKGHLDRVRVLGPLRSETQIEISVTDGFMLGVPVPVRESGSLVDTPGINLVGPKGSVYKNSGVIAALRHIHMTPQNAQDFGIKDKDLVCVKVGDGLRKAILHNVLVRVSEKFVLEMHLDIDEANATGIKSGDYATICK